MPVDPSGTNAPRVEEIRHRVYEIYEQRGRIDGYALEDWLEAEGQVQ